MTRITLLALTAAYLVACDDARTYYPVEVCGPARCEVLAHGKPYKRVVDALPPERYTAIPAQQDVVVTSGITTFSLVKDYSLECRVADQRNWQCVGPSDRDTIPEGYFMRDGELLHGKSRAVGENDHDVIVYTRWCDWQQVRWHNDTEQDDPPGLQRYGLSNPLSDVVYWLTGCLL
jgi:hypothetical protein